MIHRVAFFATKEDLETYFNFETDNNTIFEADYNIPPGKPLPMIVAAGGEETIQVESNPWGLLSNSDAEKTTLPSGQAESEIKKNNALRCVIPLSGFYVWKDKQQQDQPFFVRMLNSSVMAVAGVLEKRGESGFARIVTTESNPLIQPMTPDMPLLLDRDTSLRWLNAANNIADVIEAANRLYLLTDLSVLRVSKKVNDPKNNNQKLIQPIPK